GAGAIVLWRSRRRSLLLVAAVTVTPAAAMMLARFGNSTSPESRHLIFELPFFLTLVAAALVEAARSRLRIAPAIVAIALAAPRGGAVSIVDASDTNNFVQQMHIRLRYPEPALSYEARVYGPFLVIRSMAPTRTIGEFLKETESVMQVGKDLYIGDADINLHTA